MLVFQESPDVYIWSNCFKNVPVILQIENVPLLEVVQSQPASYGAKFTIFNSDGVAAAVVNGNQMYRTDDGKKMNLMPRFEPNLTAFELNGQTVLELRRQGAAALKGWAELYSPEGVLIRAQDVGVSSLLGNGEAIQLGGSYLRDSVFEDGQIGILIQNGMISVGTGCRKVYIGSLAPEGM